MKMFRQHTFTFLLGILCTLQFITVSAQTELVIPDGYYDNANGLAGAKLKTALHEIIEVGTRVSYGSGTWTAFEKTDKTDDGYVWDMYSYEKRTFPGGGSAPSGMNIEHSVAKSWWGGSNNNAYKDLYHLNPSDSKANSARSNYPLGVATNGNVTGSLKIGSNTFGNQYSGNCFEPLDEYKGDFARAYMYMFTCYEDLSWTSTNAPTMITANEKYPMLRTWAAELLVKWSKEDPVSEKEIKRATEIYKIQNNRNPFIDYPELADYLWGDKKGLPYEFAQSDAPRIVYPVNGQSFTMPEISYMANSSLDIRLKAVNLTSPVSISLNGDSKDLFVLSRRTLTPVDGTIDEILTITFYPFEKCTESVEIIFSSNGNEFADTKAQVTATANENFYALEASEIGSNSFVANWTPLSTTDRFELDVYTKTITGTEAKTLATASFNSSLDTGWSTVSGGYISLTDEKGAIRIASGSSPGGVTSPAIDLRNGGIVKFNAKAYGNDTGVSLAIKVDDVTVENVTITSSYTDYTVTLGKYNSDSKVTIYAVKSKRAYLSEVAITTQGQLVENISLGGYPKVIEGANSYKVEGVNGSTDYFYTITPINSDWSKSEEMKVTTSPSTGLEEELEDIIEVYYQSGYIQIENCEEGDIVFVYDLSGKVISNGIAYNTNHQVNIDIDGVYIVRVYSRGKTYTKKLYVDISTIGSPVRQSIKKGSAF